MPRYGLQLEKLFPLAKGETTMMKEQLVKLCRGMGIRPEWFMVDRTGNGSGVHDLMKSEWSPAVRGVNYSSGATEKKILVEDTMTPKQEHDRIMSELWFATKKFLEFEYLLISPSVDLEKLVPQLTTRLFRQAGSKSHAESKTDYIHRGYQSPNEADALTLLVHCVRMASEVTLSMVGAAEVAGEEDNGPSWHRVDDSNKTDTLDESERHNITDREFTFEEW